MWSLYYIAFYITSYYYNINYYSLHYSLSFFSSYIFIKLLEEYFKIVINVFHSIRPPQRGDSVEKELAWCWPPKKSYLANQRKSSERRIDWPVKVPFPCDAVKIQNHLALSAIIISITHWLGFSVEAKNQRETHQTHRSDGKFCIFFCIVSYLTLSRWTTSK